MNSSFPEYVLRSNLGPFNVNKQHITVGPGVQKLFTSMDAQNAGKISSKELQQAFEVFQGKRFTEATCKFVVRLFDLDKNGGLNVKEFETLYFYVKQWTSAFNKFDTGNTGFLTVENLTMALEELDIHFSKDFAQFLLTRNNEKAETVSLDQYLVMCIQIQRFTDEFKQRDISLKGKIELGYEEFLELIMKCL